MSDHISQSASLESIATYLKQVHGYDQLHAQQEAKQVIADLSKMQRLGYIEGWFFDEQGHLELLPNAEALARIQMK